MSKAHKESWAEWILSSYSDSVTPTSDAPSSSLDTELSVQGAAAAADPPVVAPVTSRSVDKLSVSKARPSIHTGRGGAGNLALSTNAYGLTGPPRSPSWPVSPVTPVVGKTSAVYGRGGAGNHAASGALTGQMKNERGEAERTEAEALREKIEHDVESMLKPPQGALLADGRRRESGVGTKGASGKKT